MSQSLKLGAILFPGFEMLDLYGPLEMFGAVGKENLEICMVAEHAGPVHASLGADGPTGPRGSRTRRGATIAAISRASVVSTT